jgi:hypothetical protein
MSTPDVIMPDSTRPRVSSLSHTQWHVEAFWLGKQRTVYVGTLYECLQYVKEISDGR